MTYIIDTNIFLRTLIKDDDKVFSDCINLLELVKKNKINVVVPGVVFAEVIWVLSSFYKFPKSKVIRAVNSIQKLSGIKIIDSYDYNQTFSLYEEKNVKYIDCLIASLVKDKSYVVISYDKDFDKLKIKRQEPEEFLV
jgi:predicted nucleic-acid-binding protein